MQILDIFDLIKLPFRKEKELYSSLRDIIGFYPRNIHYYQQALMHKSLGHKEKGKPVNNERLEFLGDAVLDSVVGHIVYSHFPGKREGFLTNTRSKIVQRETLGRLAQEMGINQLIVSNGRSSSHNSYMGGNAFEALVGAIYLDRGYDACMRFMQKRILKEVINIDKVAYKEVNFKSKLIEWSQKNRVKLDFRLLKQEKDANGSPKFYYQVALEEKVLGEKGEGYSKKEAQQQASKLTLQRLRKEPQFIDRVFGAKTERTKMEEMPTMAVPDTEEQHIDFIQESAPHPMPSQKAKPRKGQTAERLERFDGTDPKPMSNNPQPTKKKTVMEEVDELHLDDIKAEGPSREDIIAAAEAAAFEE